MHAGRTGRLLRKAGPHASAGRPPSAGRDTSGSMHPLHEQVPGKIPPVEVGTRSNTTDLLADV